MMAWSNLTKKEKDWVRALVYSMSSGDEDSEEDRIMLENIQKNI